MHITQNHNPPFLTLALTLALALAGCATPAQQSQQSSRIGLRLTPLALGQAISLQQHLTVKRGERIDELDAALEVDAKHLELVGLAFGQRVLSLHYDGNELQSWRHAMLPAQVRSEDVLEDLQLTLWPSAAINQALPAGWRVADEGLRRTLYNDATVVTVIDYGSLPRWSGVVKLENRRYNYQLTIQSAPNDPDRP